MIKMTIDRAKCSNKLLKYTDKLMIPIMLYQFIQYIKETSDKQEELVEIKYKLEKNIDIEDAMLKIVNFYMLCGNGNLDTRDTSTRIC